MLETFCNLYGCTLKNIEVRSDEIYYTLDNGDVYMQYHSQDYCEGVYVYDVIGEVEDLIGAPILMAQEVSSFDEIEDTNVYYGDSWTWTFYKLATIKGYVTIRWFGSSNGYYSERVDWEKV